MPTQQSKFKVTNPYNLVQAAYSRLGGYAGVSAITGVKLSTVKQWRYSHNIPLKYIGVVAGAAKISPLELYHYVTKHKTSSVPNKVRPYEILDALLEGKPTGLPERTEALLHKHYPKDKLLLLKDIFQRLQQRFDSQYEYSCAIASSAQALGIKRCNMFRLMRQFSVERQSFLTQVDTKAAKQATAQKRARQKELSVSVIKGIITGKEAAVAIEQNYWQMLRIVESHLAKYPGYTPGTLRKLPRLIRLAIGNEVAADPNSEEDNGSQPLSLKLKALYDEFYNESVIYKIPLAVVHALFKDKLILVLDGDIGLQELSQATGVKTDDLIRFFDSQLSMFGISYGVLAASSISHQVLMAEILKHSRY